MSQKHYIIAFLTEPQYQQNDLHPRKQRFFTFLLSGSVRCIPSGCPTSVCVSLQYIWVHLQLLFHSILYLSIYLCLSLSIYMYLSIYLDLSIYISHPLNLLRPPPSPHCALAAPLLLLSLPHSWCAVHPHPECGSAPLLPDSVPPQLARWG